MNHSIFSEKIKAYLKAAGYSQKMLANTMGLNPSLLNHKLNGTGRTLLTHPEVREIIKQLASLEAITRQEEAQELLALADCPGFSQETWMAAPLNKLELEPNSYTRPGTGNQDEFLPSNKRVNQLTKGNISSHQSNNYASPQNLLPPTTADKPRHNLPQQLSSFIGRQNEINELKRLLVQDKVRLLTLTGAGGCGKTRLSLEVAADLLENFPDGVWFIELAPLNDPTLIPQTIARALGLADSVEGSFVNTLKVYLHSRHLLLVLDNCEHLIDECARLVETLILSSNRLKVFASSRETFGIIGETTFRVPSLSTPDPHLIPEVDTLSGYEAIGLFLDRATAVRPHFALTKLNARAVVELCSHLDGIPLAIELAAARIKVLTVEEIATRLDDRFQLLTGGSRTALPRQQTLLALIDWSYELLSPAEKKLLAYLSVFAGGWTLKAAQVVNRGEYEAKADYEILDGLSGLVNKSLVQIEEGKDDSEIRYYFLETIRQYGLEKLKALGKERELRERHLAYYATLVQEYGVKIIGSAQIEGLKGINREIDNIRVAIGYALKLEDFERVAQLANTYYWYLVDRYSEGRYYLEKALALPGAKGANRGKVLFAVGLLAMQQRDLTAVFTNFDQCKALSGQYEDEELLWDILAGKAIISFIKGNMVASQSYTEEALPVAEKLGNSFMNITQTHLGETLVAQGSYEKARRLYEEAMRRAQKDNNLFGICFIAYSQATLAMRLKDFSSLHNHLDKVMNIADEITHSTGLSFSGKCTALNWRAIAWSHEDNFEAAHQALEESLDMGLEGFLRIASWETLLAVAFLIRRVWQKREQAGLLEHVACLCGAMSDVDKKVGWVSNLSFQTYYAEALEVARSGLEQGKFEEAFARGQEMTLEEALAYARQALNSI